MSADIGRIFEDWRQHAPAFLVHIQTPVATGSGIQIDAHHVVTCLHVVCRDGPNATYEYKDRNGQFPNVIHEVATIRCGRFASQGTVIAQHEFLDLALMRLANPRPGVAPLLPAEVDLCGRACMIGMKRMAERFDVLLHPIEIEMPASSQGTVPTQVKHAYGALEGMSGGGVFAEQGGAIRFVGISSIGGEFASFGSYIPAGAVFGLIRQELGIQHVSPSSASANGLLARGFAPAWEFTNHDPELKLPFAAISRDETNMAATVSFISRRVVSAREVRLKPQQPILPGHWRLPAWSDRIEDAETAVRGLGTLVGTRFRLPTPDELEIAWRGSHSSRTVEGRPAALADFVANGRGIEIPPPGIAEWARDRNGIAYAFERSGDGGASPLVPVPLDQAAGRQPSFRIAFDIEGT
ncbi:S1 family peptidase [Bradyrhizobium liaoningense]